MKLAFGFFSLIPFLLFAQGMPEHFMESLPELPSAVCNSTRDYKTDFLTKVDKVLDEMQDYQNKTSEQSANSMDNDKMLTMNSAAANGNISEEDVKKMEGMSDTEQAAYIQKLMKDAMKNNKKDTPQNTQQKVQDFKTKRNEQVEFMAMWSKRFADFSDSLKAIKDDADIFYYDNKINEMQTRLLQLMGEGDNTAEAKGLVGKINSACVKYCDMFSGRLLIQLRDYKEYIKSQFANIRKYEKNVYANSGVASPDLAALDFISKYAALLKNVFQYDLQGEKVL